MDTACSCLAWCNENFLTSVLCAWLQDAPKAVTALKKLNVPYMVS